MVLKRKNNYKILDLAGRGGRVGIMSTDRLPKKKIGYTLVDMPHKDFVKYGYLKQPETKSIVQRIKLALPYFQREEALKNGTLFDMDLLKEDNINVDEKQLTNYLDLYEVDLKINMNDTFGLRQQLEIIAQDRKFDEIHCHLYEHEYGKFCQHYDPILEKRTHHGRLQVIKDYLKEGGTFHHSWGKENGSPFLELSNNFYNSSRSLEAVSRKKGLKVDTFWKRNSEGVLETEGMSNMDEEKKGVVLDFQKEELMNYSKHAFERARAYLVLKKL